MSHTPVRCEHEGIHEYARGAVEKYSPDQSAWAERKLYDELSWGRRLLVSRFGIRVPRLHGDWLREVFREPEDGYAYAEGNILVTTGLQNLGYLLLATTPSGANGRALTPTNAGATSSGSICGVGTGSTTPVQGDTALTNDNTANAYYQQMDALWPTLSGTGVAGGGQLNGQMTAGSGSANFVWQEWCWASCSNGTVTAGTHLSAVASNVAMFNHWEGTSLGTKGAGATWVFSTTVTFS